MVQNLLPYSPIFFYLAPDSDWLRHPLLSANEKRSSAAILDAELLNERWATKLLEKMEGAGWLWGRGARRRIGMINDIN